MNFSDETVTRVKTAEFYKVCGMYRVGLGGVNDIVRAVLSSLTLADLMQVDEVREIAKQLSEAVELLEREATSSAGKVFYPAEGWAGLNGQLVKSYPPKEYDIDAMGAALKPFLEAK